MTQTGIKGRSVGSAEKTGRIKLLSLLGVLAVCATGCASTAAGAASTMPVWADTGDCFLRDVTVPATEAAATAMAASCAGGAAAGDPARSGIDRSTSYFNAASAYLALGQGNAENDLCPAPGDCFSSALSLAELSVANQGDDQMSNAASAAASLADSRFVLRRAILRSRALQGLADTENGVDSCGGKTSCLTQAAETLNSLALAPAELEEADKLQAQIACEGLDLRWRVNSELGRAQEHAYLQDLAKIVDQCPRYKATASDRLAEISFDHAESIRRSLASAETSNTDAAIAAITRYHEALEVDRFTLPSYRGLGEVHRWLALADRASRRAHLENAVEAFRTSADLSGTTTDVGGRARDLELLGQSQLELAQTYSTSEDAAPLIQEGSAALSEAVSLEPTAQRSYLLAQAYQMSGQTDLAIRAYEAALSGLNGLDRVEASLSLADLLDRVGNPAEALQVLERASAQGPVDAEVEYEIGRRRFANGAVVDAQAPLIRAVSSLTGSRLMEAHYMLSIIETKKRATGWKQRAMDHAMIAANGGTQIWKYSRQACLATILLGGADLESGVSASNCPDVRSPEGKLLKGMFYLKQAQLTEVSAYNLPSQTRWRSILRAAEDAFREGQNLSGSAPAYETRVRFDDLAGDVDVPRRLEQGLSVVARCRRDIQLGPADPVWPDLESFFGQYGVLKCSGAS
ncbi:MAG: tetratricopeptide repeat protein [Hyphomonas sp.]|uniref:tetratricopeptide repeat protein n=1 Tax=Hyphomonas sp. TaxID=87 RepID=UPI0035299F71